MFRVTCILENSAFELVEFEINEAGVIGTVAELYERGDSQPLLQKTSPEMIKKYIREAREVHIDLNTGQAKNLLLALLERRR